MLNPFILFSICFSSPLCFASPKTWSNKWPIHSCPISFAFKFKCYPILLILIHSKIGVWIPRRGFRTLDSRYWIPRIFCQLTLDSGFQSPVGLRIPWAVFQIQKPRIPDSTSKNFSDSGIQTVPYMGRLEGRRPLDWLTFLRCCFSKSGHKSVLTTVR